VWLDALARVVLLGVLVATRRQALGAVATVPVILDVAVVVVLDETEIDAHPVHRSGHCSSTEPSKVVCSFCGR
jgi:hypothetical protein